MTEFENWITSTAIACRGLHNTEVPENSLTAIKNAIDKGYAVCIDVRALADNTIVVFCDETVGRMTGTDGFIANLTYDQIKNLRLNKTEEHIPTLDEVLKLVAGKVPVIVEIKNMDKVSWEKYVWKELSGYKGEYAIISKNPYSLEWFKLNAPKAKRGQISSFYKKSSLPFSVRFAYKRMKLNNTVSEPNFIVYKSEDLPNRFVKKYKNLPLLAYHVNSQENYDRVKKYVNNVIFENIEI